jgi:cold-inducible RNA-binding protein
MSNNKLYVGNLTYDATQEDLQDLFTQVGEVTDVVVMMDKFTGRSRGFGFVTMGDDSSASAACEQFDGKDFQGRKLTVNIARPREDRPQGGGGGGGGGRKFGGGGGGGDRRPARRY